MTKNKVRAYLEMERAIHCFALDRGMTDSSAKILLFLGDGQYTSRHHQSITVGEEFSSLSGSTVSTAITELFRRRLVKKGIDEYSQRERHISLTSNGERVCMSLLEYLP
jgi:DNA-binding MarR family transcriptional regulator